MTDQARGSTAAALQERHSRLTLEMALLLLGAWLTQDLPLPWRAAGVVFSLLALVQGVRAVMALRRHRRAHPDLQAMGPAGGVLLALGVAVAAGLTVMQALLLAAYPVVSQQDECRDRALTRTALERCDDALLQQVRDLGGLGGLGG